MHLFETSTSSRLFIIELKMLHYDKNSQQQDLPVEKPFLQLAVPHDSRIDLIPTAHMRDRMILFRSQMDYDRCFSLLMDHAVFHGGDPTLRKNWEMSPEFFSEFWYLMIDYDLERTNHWRRLQGLAEIEAGPVVDSDDEEVDTKKLIEAFYQDPTEAKIVELWELDLWSQISKGIP
jgi:hypothetical protein